jgi:hypothetical protein
MKTTGIESFEAGLPVWEFEDSIENLHIGDRNQSNIQKYHRNKD